MTSRRALSWTVAIFFSSGFSALLYQVVWQRALFTFYGTNIESITVIVAAFMLGLGLGSLFGGQVSARLDASGAIRTFALVELAIGGFGAISLPLFRWVGHLTLGAPLALTGILTLLLVLIPTLLMGATLPILTAFAVRIWGAVGRSVGALYFVNTLGSAIACFAAGVLLLGPLGQQKTVFVAAALNVLAGVLAYIVARRPAVAQ